MVNYVSAAARRSLCREGTTGPEIVIPVRRNWAVLVVVPVWLTLWISGIVGAAGQVISGRARGGEAGFFEVWLIVAVAAGATVVYYWLWNAIGREVVGRRPGLLMIRRDVAGLGFSREYSLADVRNLRVSLPPPDAARWAPPLRLSRDAGAIAFDHDARTVRFGRGLDEAEARLVLAELGVRTGIERPAA
jgi:hypothetical protein